MKSGVSKAMYHEYPACLWLTPTVAARDQAALTMAADFHSISRITQIWSDRLQLISVYASFFTSIDSVLFSLASSKDTRNTTSRLMLASLVGALIFHAATGSDFTPNSLFFQLTVWPSDSGLRGVFCPYPL